MKELVNGKIYNAFKTLFTMYKELFKVMFKFMSPFLIIVLLGFLYNSLYNKYGLDKVIISGVIMMIYYLGKINGELKKWNLKQ